ncbi:hypothetical protein P4H66_20675 [Paenibacillus dokdonensis]|uniref:Uncharacterized protein n=1 Tax=Paenibacillus dokdonensis TaxID=2567944 RepID=A0ABU6GR89_9BACL|nr:hypothetical protein [Paenibacillus dokdonensis]MEC0242223.1 hypothetical protein [Paenibacillus dokdonensis]
MLKIKFLPPESSSVVQSRECRYTLGIAGESMSLQEGSAGFLRMDVGDTEKT